MKVIYSSGTVFGGVGIGSIAYQTALGINREENLQKAIFTNT